LRDREDFERVLTVLPTKNHYVMDYVISEILSHHPPAVQACMMKASVLSRFCAPLCEVVCGSDTDSVGSGLNGRELVKLLVNANLFIIPLDEERNTGGISISFL